VPPLERVDRFQRHQLLSRARGRRPARRRHPRCTDPRAAAAEAVRRCSKFPWRHDARPGARARCECSWSAPQPSAHGEERPGERPAVQLQCCLHSSARR
jgi:hypothetical protein